MDYSLVIDKEVGSIVDNKKTSEDKGLETTDVKHKGDEKAHDAVPLLEKKDSFEETLISDGQYYRLCIDISILTQYRLLIDYTKKYRKS